MMHLIGHHRTECKRTPSLLTVTARGQGSIPDTFIRAKYRRGCEANGSAEDIAGEVLT